MKKSLNSLDKRKKIHINNVYRPVKLLTLGNSNLLKNQSHKQNKKKHVKVNDKNFTNSHQEGEIKEAEEIKEADIEEIVEINKNAEVEVVMENDPKFHPPAWYSVGLKNKYSFFDNKKTTEGSA